MKSTETTYKELVEDAKERIKSNWNFIQVITSIVLILLIITLVNINLIKKPFPFFILLVIVLILFITSGELSKLIFYLFSAFRPRKLLIIIDRQIDKIVAEKINLRRCEVKAKEDQIEELKISTKKRIIAIQQEIVEINSDLAMLEIIKNSKIEKRQ